MIKKQLGIKNTIFFAVATLIMLCMVVYGVIASQTDFGLNPIGETTFPRGRVVEVINDLSGLDDHGIRRGQQDLLVEITSGPLRGQVLETRNVIIPELSVWAQVGTRLVLSVNYQGGGRYLSNVYSYERATMIYLLAAIFVLLMVIVGGKKGVRSTYGLVFTFVTIVFLLIPAITSGASPAILTIVASLLITVVSLIAIMGFEKKAYISIAGTSIGILAYCLFYLLAGAMLRISGVNMPETSTLLSIGIQHNARIFELLFSGILIASLGAVMDIAVSVASATAEIADSGVVAQKELFKRSMRITRDCIGSSVNTLILAFTGAFFVPLVVIRLQNFEFHAIIHNPDIALEVLRIITASSATVLAAPATALIASYLYSAKMAANYRK